MDKRKAFTLIELLVVISIIALLMAILMPALSRVKKQAQAVSCRARLKEWGLMFKFYTDDNDGYFNEGWGVGETTLWPNALRSYYKDEMDMLLCPTATRVDDYGTQGTFMAQTRTLATPDGGSYPYTFSYGINNWTNYMHGDRGTRLEEWFWKRAGQKRAFEIPVFADSTWHDAWPLDTDVPIPMPYDFGGGNQGTSGEMNHFNIDRHKGSSNFLFMDWSVRPVGLKELWTLRWHRNFDRRNAYTRLGNVSEADWPQWMRKYPEF